MSKAAMRSSVVLPAPLGPSSATNSPAGISSVTLRRATSEPKRFSTRSKEMARPAACLPPDGGKPTVRFSGADSVDVAEAMAARDEGERCGESFNSESRTGERGDAASGERLDNLLFSLLPQASFEARFAALRHMLRGLPVETLFQVASRAACKAVSLSPDRGRLFGLARAGGRNPRR